MDCRPFSTAADSVLIEVGPGQTLSGFARQHPARTAARAIVASLPHPTETTSDAVFFLGSLGKVWLAGIEVDFTGVYAGERRRRVPLPTYPFERQRYWIEPSERASAATVAGIRRSPPGRCPCAKARCRRRCSPIAIRPQGPDSRPIAGNPPRTERTGGRRPRPIRNLPGTRIRLVVHDPGGQRGGGQLRIRVSFRQLFEDAPTINALAIHLDERLAPEVSTPEPPELPAAASSPEHSGPHPNGSAGDAVPTEVVQRLIEQQLEVMRQQLAVLGGRAEQIGSDFVPVWRRRYRPRRDRRKQSRLRPAASRPNLRRTSSRRSQRTSHGDQSTAAARLWSHRSGATSMT